MSAFVQAWNLLKAIPGQQGYVGTLPPAVRGMYERAKEEGVEGLPRTQRGIERDLSPLREKTPTMISASGGMANVPGYETMPEESFFTPRERRLAQEGIDPTLRRNVGGQQRGQRMTDLRHQVIGSQEGVARGGRITGASREFMPEKSLNRK